MARIGNDGGFQRALARFKSHLSPAEQESFGVTSLEDVQKTIVQIQNTQGSQSQMRNFTRIKAFVEAMEQYGKVVEVFLNASSILAFVWGPIKFLLQIASTWVDSFDVLLDAYEEISEKIPQLLKYGEIFEQHAHMRKILELMYGDILEFHRRALKFFSRPTWKKLFHSSWKTFGTQFQYILSSLSRHKSLIENQASLLDYEQSKFARVAAQNSFEEIAEAERKRRSLAVTDKIRPPNTRIDQDKAKETRQEYPESGKWILQNAFLRDWMDLHCPDVPLLWVNGIPGAGKTVIASLIIEETEPINSVVVGFFYCRYSDAQKNSFNKILGGILAQMVKQNEELLSYIYDECCSSNETTIESESLLKRLVEVSLRTCANTCIIIDGIDECEEVEERKAIAWFLEMSKIITKDNAGSIRLLFISQRDKVTESLLNRASVITLDSKYHQEDIQAYASHWSVRIQRKFGISEASASRISIDVATKAQGLFLFARLVLMYLYTQTTREKLFRELQPDSFPTGLEAAYERIALRIFENPNLSEREDAHNVFRWLVCARRPLKWSDIQSIFAIDPLSSRVDFDERQLRVTCRDLCGSLVESNSEDTLELVHNSAKQYLIKSGRISMRSEELHIAEFCLSYLSFRCFDADMADSDIREFLREGYYSFEDYAIAHWLDHLNSSTSHLLPLESSSFESLRQRIDSFFSRHGSVSPPNLSIANTQKFQSIRQWHSTRRLDALAQLASEKTSNKNYLDVETQLQRRRLIYEDILTDTNPLGEVLRMSLRLNGSGCFKCPKTWCGYFSDGFQRGEDRDKHVGQHERPFRCSFEECLHAKLGFGLVKELKRHEKTSHPTGQSSEWAFPAQKPRKPLDVFSASAKGDLATVERLVGEGVDINKTTKPKGSITALSLAVKHSQPQIASYLIGQGCKADPPTLLGIAMQQSSSITSIRMLLEIEAEPSIKKALAQDALYYIAARCFFRGGEEAIRLVLTYDIDINKRTALFGPHKTALKWARVNEYDNIVQILLENGARDEREEAEQPPTPTPTTPITPKNSPSFAPSKADSTGPANMMTSIASAPLDQLVPQQQLPNTAMSEFNSPGTNVDKSYIENFNPDLNNTDILENFDFEQFLQTEGDFNFDPSTFEDGEQNTSQQRQTQEPGQPQQADPTFIVANNPLAAQRHAQAQAQAQAEAAAQQRMSQQQQHHQAQRESTLRYQMWFQQQQQQLQQQQQRQQQQANAMVPNNGNQGINQQQFLQNNAAPRSVNLTPHLQQAQQRTHQNAQLAHIQQQQAQLHAQQQAAAKQQQDAQQLLSLQDREALNQAQSQGNPRPTQPGVAPAAQMVAPNSNQASMRGSTAQVPNSSTPVLPPPTMHEVTAARAQLPAEVKGVTDEQLRQMISHKRQQAYLKVMQGQSNLTLQQQQHQQQQQYQNLIRKQQSQGSLQPNPPSQLPTAQRGQNQQPQPGQQWPQKGSEGVGV